MKIFTLILCAALQAQVTMAVVALPPATGTNQLAEFYRATSINTALNNSYYCIGRIERLERELDRLETGFLVLAVLIGSSLVSLCLLAARDRIRKQKEMPVCGTGMNVNAQRSETD